MMIEESFCGVFCEKNDVKKIRSKFLGKKNADIEFLNETSKNINNLPKLEKFLHFERILSILSKHTENNHKQIKTNYLDSQKSIKIEENENTQNLNKPFLIFRQLKNNTTKISFSKRNFTKNKINLSKLGQFTEFTTNQNKNENDLNEKDHITNLQTLSPNQNEAKRKSIQNRKSYRKSHSSFPYENEKEKRKSSQISNKQENTSKVSKSRTIENQENFNQNEIKKYENSNYRTSKIQKISHEIQDINPNTNYKIIINENEKQINKSIKIDNLNKRNLGSENKNYEKQNQSDSFDENENEKEQEKLKLDEDIERFMKNDEKQDQDLIDQFIGLQKTNSKKQSHNSFIEMKRSHSQKQNANLKK